MPVGVIDFGSISPLAKGNSICSAERMAAADLVVDAAAHSERRIVVITVGDRVASGSHRWGDEID
jgi:hypothetical protein